MGGVIGCAERLGHETKRVGWTNAVLFLGAFLGHLLISANIQNTQDESRWTTTTLRTHPRQSAGQGRFVQMDYGEGHFQRG